MSRKKKGAAERRALFLDDEAAFHRKFGLAHDPSGFLTADWRVSGTEPSGLPPEHESIAEIDRRYSSDRERQLQQEISMLRSEFDVLRRAFEDEKRGANDEKSALLARLRETLDRMQRQQTVADILSRVHPEARAVVVASTELENLFRDGSATEIFVMSVDIRRSTDLMLQARTPQLYATFVTGVCDILKEIVLVHHGIFDKFTGDGILAFFPAFYTGEDAGLRAVNAAADCHTAFEAHYHQNRNTFKLVPADIGLGIGIDCGETHLLRVADGLTVVGNPVVHACRLGDAPAGVTLLNQPAYEVVLSRYREYCDFNEIKFEIKHGDVVIAYTVTPNGRRFEFPPPLWKSFMPKPPQ